MKDNGDESSNRNLNGGLAIKRFLDVIVSGLALGVLVVPFLITAVAIKLESKGPVFFRQERMGKDAKPFMIYKFRTMKQGSENIRYYIDSNNPSVTKLGRWLRRWGLDELPQLLNVLKGEMSLVGPRPTLRYQVEKYDEQQKLRLNMKPGLTGLSQVKGRNKLNWSQRMKYDLLYTQHWSLRMDTKIFLLTPVALLRRDFATADGVAEDDIVRGV